MSKVKVNEIDKRSGSTLTLGGSGTTVQLGTGATQTRLWSYRYSKLGYYC